MKELKELPVVAKSVFFECKKCGVDRYLRVMAHVDATHFKAECEVCKSKRTYSIKPVKPTKAKSGLTRKSASEKGSTHTWMSLKEKYSGDQAQPYSMKMKFELNSAISHPKFGLGFIVASTSQSIDVQFEESFRSLVHNRTT